MTDEQQRPGTGASGPGEPGRFGPGGSGPVGSDIGPDSGPDPDPGVPSLVDLLGFDPTEESAEDVPAETADRLHALLVDAVEDEPPSRTTPLTVLAAARRAAASDPPQDSAPTAHFGDPTPADRTAHDADRAARRVDDLAAVEAEYDRLRRRSAVIKGLLIAAAAALVVVAVPSMFRETSSSTSMSAASTQMAADSVAGQESVAGAESGSGSAGGAEAPAAGSGLESSAAAQTSAAASSLVPSAGQPGPEPNAGSGDNASTGKSDRVSTSAASSESRAQAPATTATTGGGAVTDSGGKTGCTWPQLDTDVVAAALLALDLPAQTPVAQPVTPSCPPGRIGAVTIPSAGITVLVTLARTPGADSTYGYTSATLASGAGIQVAVLAEPAGGPARQVGAAQRQQVAGAVLAALR